MKKGNLIVSKTIRLPFLCRRAFGSLGGGLLWGKRVCGRGKEPRGRVCGHGGDFASAEARRWTEPVWQLSDRPRHPFGPLLIDLYRGQTLAGRGGSVSRRDHSQAYRRRARLTGGTNYAEAHNSNASRSSGEGVWGGGASLREAASSPESPVPPPHVFRGGSAREGTFLQKSPLPRIL